MPHIFRVLILIVLSTFLTTALAASESSIEGVTEHRLPNGLRVVLAPDEKASAISMNLVYLTGSRADRAGEGRGTAHLLEHLLFKGTLNYPNGALNGSLVSEMTRRGFQFNGTTSHDRTMYHAVCSRRRAAQLVAGPGSRPYGERAVH